MVSSKKKSDSGPQHGAESPDRADRADRILQEIPAQEFGSNERLANAVVDGVEEDQQTEMLEAVGLDAEGGRQHPTVDTSDIESRLSYGVFDWEVTDDEVRDNLRALDQMDPEQLRQAMRQIPPELMARMEDNLTDAQREGFPRTLGRIRDAQDQVALDQQAERPIDESEMELFVDGIDSSDVIQSQDMNDCYMVSALASAADQNPEFVRDMVQDQGDGTYRVRLYERNEQGDVVPVFVTVDALPANQYAHSDDQTADGQREGWPSIVERAYAEHNGGWSETNWGNSEEGHMALFGDEGTRVELQGNGASPTAQADMQAAVSNGDAVVASTGSHVVQVQNVAPDGTVTIRNQQAEGGESDRVETMTWDEFQQQYQYVRHTPISGPQRLDPRVDTPTPNRATA